MTAPWARAAKTAKPRASQRRFRAKMAQRARGDQQEKPRRQLQRARRTFRHVMVQRDVTGETERTRKSAFKRARAERRPVLRFKWQRGRTARR